MISIIIVNHNLSVINRVDGMLNYRGNSLETPNVWGLSSFHPNISKQPPPPQCLGFVLFSPRRFYRAEVTATWMPRQQMTRRGSRVAAMSAQGKTKNRIFLFDMAVSVNSGFSSFSLSLLLASSSSSLLSSSSFSLSLLLASSSSSLLSSSFSLLLASSSSSLLLASSSSSLILVSSSSSLFLASSYLLRLAEPPLEQPGLHKASHVSLSFFILQLRHVGTSLQHCGGPFEESITK